MRDPGKGTFYCGGYSDLDAKARLSSLRKALGASMYTIHFTVPDIAEDILWQQMKKLSSRLGDELSSNGFAPLLSFQNLRKSEALVTFVVRDATIKASIAKGPSVFMGAAASRFIEARKKSHMIALDCDRLYSIDVSKYPTPTALLKAFLLDKDAKLPSYLDKRRMRIYVNSMPESIAKLVYQAYNGRKINYKG
jgi:tRNA nucleotidyltransferase (CCA-adding enzyme)